jgi:hypothetical protein
MSEDIAKRPSEEQHNQLPSSKQREPQHSPREVEAHQRDTFLSLYSNNISVRTTPFDMQLIFGEILSVDEHKLAIENFLAVNLSPQTAKSLLNVISGQIDAYEQQYGEIRYNPIQPHTEEPSA